MNRKRTLGRFIVKKYIMFSLALILLVSLIYNIIGTIGNMSDSGYISNYLLAEKLVRPDYKNIDVTYLKDISGWIEILDKNDKVIYTKGKVLEKKNYYTRDELLEQAAFRKETIDKSVHLPGFNIAMSLSPSAYKTKYIASYAPFTAENGKKYVCIAKIPVEKIKFRYTVINAVGEMGRRTASFIIVTLGCVALVFAACVYWYSQSVKKHVAKPNKVLVEGLKTITSGNYEQRLNMNAEYEYREIEDSFNYMAAELEQSKNQRKNYEEERQQLLSNIVHDLKTPITSIRGYAKALIEGMVKDSGRQQEYLQTIYNKTEHLNRLTELLMTYTKMDNSNYALKLDKVDFTELVREIIADCFDELEKKNMKLELDIPDEVIEVWIDKTEMSRAIENLILNAVKHNNEKTTVKICVSKEENKNTVLQVWDNGTEIPETLSEKMFEPFICGDESRTTNNGSGLGLSICRKIVEKHNGRLEYRCLKDGWKCFIIKLP